MARESNGAQHVYFEQPQSIGVGSFRERFDLEDAEMVHQNIGVGNLFNKHFDASGGSEIRVDTANIGIFDALPDLRAPR